MVLRQRLGCVQSTVKTERQRDHANGVARGRHVSIVLVRMYAFLGDASNELRRGNCSLFYIIIKLTFSYSSLTYGLHAHNITDSPCSNIMCLAITTVILNC